MPAKKVAVIPAIERIREIAYQLWIDAGRPDGEAEAHWFQAELIAASETEAPKTAKKAPVRKKAA